jgi:hemerythrin-like domain-containing protein
MTTHTTTTDRIGATDVAPTPADLSSYYLIHRALRWGAERVADAVARATLDGDVRRMTAVARWYREYQAELHEHHEIEDERFFPALHDRVPVMADHEPRLQREHELVVDAMHRTDEALTRLTASPGDAAARADAVAASAGLRDVLVAHLAYEDADILPLFVRHFGAGEYAELEQDAMRSVPLRTQIFTVPFMVEAAVPGGEREALVADAPAAMRMLLRLTRGRYARRTEAAFR